MQYPRVIAALSLTLAPVVSTHAEDLPWWGTFPRIVQGQPADLKPYNADVVFHGGMNAPSWGTWGQVLFGQPGAAEAIKADGGRAITYFETFGQSYCAIIALPDGARNSEAPRAATGHWSWGNYKGDPIYWVGAHSWFDDLPEARPWTRSHGEFGGEPMRYPDGTIATGYDGDPANPMNHRAFDAGCSKNVLGEISFEFDPSSPEVQEKGPHTGLMKFGDTWTGLLFMHKDSACPHWLDLDEAAVRYAARHGAEGMWSDNFSPWDSFGIRPVERGFGEWSVAKFRDYLRDHLDAEGLARLGVAELASFDVRAALRDQVTAWGGDPKNLHDPRWSDPRWLDHELWLAYVVFKRQEGTRALTAYDTRMRAAAKAEGQPEFLISGNDIPALSLGWVRGELDMVSTESPAGYGLDAGSRGLMLPPVGRHSVRYRLAAVHARANTVNLWPYLDGELARYGRNPNLTRVMAYEMLAANALPMAYPSLPRVLGDPEAYAEFFAFVGEARKHFGQRRPIARTGLYYSSSSLLAFMTPGGFLDFNARPHQFGYYGWATALHDLHEPYAPVPEWRLNTKILADLDLLIVPNASVIDDAAVAILTPWLEAGGRLLITGESGIRAGESGHFLRHDRGPLQARLDKKGVHHMAENSGFDYYLESAGRPDLLPAMANHLRAARGDETPMITAPGVPATIGITPHYNPDTKALFIDINNLNIDLDADTIFPAGPITFEITLPEPLRDAILTHQILSPEPGVTTTITPLDGGRISVTVGALELYASVMVTATTS